MENSMDAILIDDIAQCVVYPSNQDNFWWRDDYSKREFYMSYDQWMHMFSGRYRGLD